jgi:hypothetical protein
MWKILALVGVTVAAIPGFSNPLFTSTPAGIDVTTFASNLNFPTSLVPLSNGSVLIGATTPAGTGNFTNFYTGSGQVLRFTQTNGVADGPGTAIIPSLGGAVTSIRPLGDLLAVATAGNQTFAGLGSGDINIFKPGANPGDAYSNLGGLHFQFSAYDAAINLTLATVPTGTPGVYDVYFVLGAGNSNGTPVPGGVAMTGLAAGTLAAGSLYKVTIDTNGVTPSVGTPVQLASGIRNSGGILVAPNGDVYFDDNGFESNLATVSADELNRLTAAQIASNTVFSFGYPDNYTDANGNVVGGAGVQPLAAFLTDANGAMFGAAEMAFAPTNFPTGLNNGIFIGFDGQFSLTGIGNVNNPVLYYSFDTNTYTRFIDSGQAGIGHLIGLASTADALYISDFATGDGFPGGAGVVYELQSTVPEPAESALMLFGLTAVVLRFAGNRRKHSA